jgi:MFS family permease
VAYGAGYIVNFSDILPAYSSVVFGITTAAATVGALIANVIAGFVIKQPILEHWRKLFILFAVIYFIGGVAFVILGSAKPRKWATHKAQQNQEIKDKILEEETIPMQPSEAAKSPEA